MADDQNRSNNRKGMNTTADDIDRSQVLTELERIGARASRKGIQRTQLEERIKAEGKLYNSLIHEANRTPGLVNTPFYREQTTSLRESIRNIRTQMNTLDTTARTRAESEASTYIGRQFGSTAINGQVSSIQKESNVQNRAFSMSQMSYDELQARREDILATIRVKEREAQNEVKGMFSGRGQVDPEKSAALGVMMGGMHGHLRELAMVNAAQGIQKVMGNDPNSKTRSLLEAGQSARSLLSTELVGQEVKAGGVQISRDGKQEIVKNADINRELIKQAATLTQALEKLARAAEEGSEDLDKLRGEADEAASNFKKLEEGQQALKSGRGGFNAVAFASGIAGSFNAIGAGAQQVLVNQRMQQTANTTGFANLANEQYEMYQKARGGDVASQLALSQFGEASKFGQEMFSGTNKALDAYMVGATAQTAAGGIETANAFKNAGLTFGALGGGEAMQGIQNTIQGGSTLAVTATDRMRGVSAQQARLAAIHANMQARMAVQSISAQQMQGLRNMYTGTDITGQELGSRANSFIAQAVSGQNITRMANARLSPEQFNQMSHMAAVNMGSTFDINQVYAARNLERRGYGNMQTNIQRMTMLSEAGANNPQRGFENVLSAAVTKGLDSSKAITAMVSNTAAMVSANGSSMAAGINNVASTSAMLAGTVDNGNPNKEFAIQRAATALEVAKSITTDTSVSFAGMLNTSRISKTTGLSGTQSIFAARLTTADLKSLQGMSPEKAQAALLEKGVDVTHAKGGVKGFLSTMLTNQTEQMLTGGGSLALGGNEMRQSLVQAAIHGTSYSKLSKEQKELLGQIGATNKLSGSEYYRQVAGIEGAKLPGAGVGGKLTSDFTKDAEDLKSSMDALRTSGFKQLSEAAGEASKTLTKAFGAAGPLKFFMTLQERYEKGGAATEHEFSTKAGEYAKSGSKLTDDFNAGVTKFQQSTTTIEKASNKLMDAANLISNGMVLVPNQYMRHDRQNYLDEFAGSKKGHKH